MKIYHERPPNFAQIAEAFPMAKNRGVIFAFHDGVYMPSGGELPDYLVPHEQVHLDRQGGTLESTLEWWEKYIKDTEFRYREELLAHVAEYKFLAANASRPARRNAFKEVSKRLASPLYGSMKSQKQCGDDIWAMCEAQERDNV